VVDHEGADRGGRELDLAGDPGPARRQRPEGRSLACEILRRVEPGEVAGYPLDPKQDRAVLGPRFRVLIAA
jgi:hypothetical protein